MLRDGIACPHDLPQYRPVRATEMRTDLTDGTEAEEPFDVLFSFAKRDTLGQSIDRKGPLMRSRGRTGGVDLLHEE